MRQLQLDAISICGPVERLRLLYYRISLKIRQKGTYWAIFCKETRLISSGIGHYKAAFPLRRGRSNRECWVN